MIRKLFLTLAVIATASFSKVSAQQTPRVTASGIGYLEYLPQGYHSNSHEYPVVISLHGIKEKGTSSTDPRRVLPDLQKVDNVGLPRYVRQGKRYPFILISPQLKSNMGVWSGSYIIDVLKHVKKHLRIDERRIYLTGLSLGGFGVWRVAGEYPDVFAAILPICAGGNSLKKAGDIAAEDLPVWGFHGSSDRIVSHNVTVKMVNAINAKRPNPMAKATIFRGMGHSIWDKVYNDTNALDWMLSYRKGSKSSHGDDKDEDEDDSGNDEGDDDDRDNDDGDRDEDDDDGDKDKDKDDDDKSNRRPVVRAGSDKTLTLPSNALHLRGSANDPDGKIESLEWKQVSGGKARLSGIHGERLKVYSLREGTYVFRLTARDNDGARRSDEVRVTVRGADKEEQGKDEQDEDKKPSSENERPKASAGPDRTITLPTNSVTIKASAYDRDGKIVSYEWAQTYGKRVSLSGENSDQVRIHDLREGKFIFRVRVKDNDGATRDDYFKITVKDPDHRDNHNSTDKKEDNASAPSGRANARPKGWGGPDRVVTLPDNAVDVRAKASDSDGRIVSYEWTKVRGNRASISGENSPNARIYNLRRGVYIFRLRVTDNDGSVKDDYFKITVKDAGKDVASHDGKSHNSGHKGNARPVANAGPDRRITVSDGSVRLSGSATDRDGKIVSYKWKKLAGPGRIAVKNGDSRRPTITNLQEGRYYFSLTVKDEDNATDVDKMAIRVTGS